MLVALVCRESVERLEFAVPLVHQDPRDKTYVKHTLQHTLVLQH